MGIRIDTTDHLARMMAIQQQTLNACLKYGEAAANKMVKEAKLKAPWDDGVPLARPSLNGGAKWDGRVVRVELAHGVHYGVFLELKRFKHKGILAIVFPTVHKMAPGIVEGWAKTVREGGKAGP